MTTTQTAPSRLTLTVEEAAQLLGIGRQSAYQAARTGELPTISLGRRLLVPKAALERMLGVEQNDRDPAGKPGLGETISGDEVAGHVPSG